MPSLINADNGVVSGSAGVKTTADTSGELALQSNGATALSINTSLVTTLAQPLPVGSGGTGATSLSGITTGTATNIAGGGAGRVPYNTGAGATAFTAAGTTGQVLQSNGTSAPTWVTPAVTAPAGTTGQVQINNAGAFGAVSSGTAGQVLTSAGAGAPPTFATPAVAGSVTAVASGSIANGKPVVVNADGTVSEVKLTPISDTLGALSTFRSGATTWNNSAYDVAQQKVFLSYTNGASGDRPEGIIATVSGTSFSYGSPVVISGNPAYYKSACYDPTTQKIIFAYSDFSVNAAACVVATVSGSSFSFGTDNNFLNARANGLGIAYATAQQKVVIAYANASNGNYGTAVVGTVSGNTVTYGTPVVFHSAPTSEIHICYDEINQKVVISYSQNSMRAIVGTLSGTNISFGSATVFGQGSYSDVVYDSAQQKIVCYYVDTNLGEYVYAKVGTVSGTGISFGTAVAVSSVASEYISAGYSTVAGKSTIAYRDKSAPQDFRLKNGQVSGTTISFSSETVVTTNTIVDPATTYDSTNGVVVISYGQQTNSRGEAVAYIVGYNQPNLTSENFIGFSSASYTNGQTAVVQTVGSTDDAQTGLTAGQTYFVQTNGTVATTPGSPSVVAGTAVSASNIIVKG